MVTITLLFTLSSSACEIASTPLLYTLKEERVIFKISFGEGAGIF
jgi:hypothetical protein